MNTLVIGYIGLNNFSTFCTVRGFGDSFQPPVLHLQHTHFNFIAMFDPIHCVCHVSRPYNEMTVCLEWWSNNLGCFYPNPIVQDLFLQMHVQFFSTCSKDDPEFEDPPTAVVLTLTLLPVCVFPVLVYMALRNNQAKK